MFSTKSLALFHSRSLTVFALSGHSCALVKVIALSVMTTATFLLCSIQSRKFISYMNCRIHYFYILHSPYAIRLNRSRLLVVLFDKSVSLPKIRLVHFGCSLEIFCIMAR